MTKPKNHPPRTKAPKVALLLDLSHQSSRSVIRGVFKYARHNGYWQIDLLLGKPDEFHSPDLSSWRGTGAIGQIRNPQIGEFLLGLKAPIVLIDPDPGYLEEGNPFYPYPSVDCDSVAVGKKAADYLLELGFENFAFIGDVNHSDWSKIREKAFYRETVELRGLNCSIFPNTARDRTKDETEEGRIVRWLRKLRTPVGIFAANDWRGVQTLQACRLAGLRVPYDAAVLGVDADELLCRTAPPELSSVALDFEWAGYEAARILDMQIRGGYIKNERSIYGPKGVVVRGSTQLDALKNDKVIEALDFIRLNAGLGVNVEEVARRVGTSRQWIGRLFRKELGRTIREEIERVRLKTAVRMIVETNLTIQEIGSRCGFVDGNRLGVLFRERFGVSPGKYRTLRRQKAEFNNVDELLAAVEETFRN